MMFLNLKENMSIREISRISGISLSTYYYSSSKRNVKRINPETERKILDIALERPTYGYRRIWALLKNNETMVNRKTVSRILKNNNLSLPVAKHKNRIETRNLFNPIAPDQLWQTDITYIPTIFCMTYLMCIKDCFSKEWQGYYYAVTCTASDAIKSVEDAVLKVFNGNIPKGLTLRVDNGPQYISNVFMKAMDLLGIMVEHIQKQTPEDNGDIESFHNSLKTDYIWVTDLETFEDAKNLIEYAFTDYNTIRPHSSISFLPPDEFERRWNESEDFRNQFLESKKRKEERILKNRNEKKRRLKENVSFEGKISVQN